MLRPQFTLKLVFVAMTLTAVICALWRPVRHLFAHKETGWTVGWEREYQAWSDGTITMRIRVKNG